MDPILIKGDKKMKKIILMAVCLVVGNLGCVYSAQAIMPTCDYLYQYQPEERQKCMDQEEQAARTEYMRREAELMKKKAELLDHCKRYPRDCR